MIAVFTVCHIAVYSDTFIFIVFAILVACDSINFVGSLSAMFVPVFYSVRQVALE